MANKYVIENGPPGQSLSYEFAGSLRIGDPFPMQLQFSAGANSVGRLFERDGRLHFEGDVEKSAESFLEFFCQSFNQRIEQLISEALAKEAKKRDNIVSDAKGSE